MSNHKNNAEQNQTPMKQNKTTRRSVQFGRVSYSDDSQEMVLNNNTTQHEYNVDNSTPCKFMERSAMCSSVPIPPPSPPQRKASAEAFLLDDEEDEVDDFGTTSICMNSLLASLVAAENSEEQKEEEKEEEEEESNHSHVRYNTPVWTARKTTSPVAPTRTSRLLGVSPSQFPGACFPARCL